MSAEDLIPWKPGQAGNPRGSSRKARSRKYVKDYVSLLVNQKVNPEDVDAKLRDKIEELGINLDDLTHGFVIAMQLVRGARNGDQVSIAQVLGTEPKVVEVETLEPPKSPEYLPDAADQKELEAGNDGVLH